MIDWRSALIALAVVQAAVVAQANERTALTDKAVATNGPTNPRQRAIKDVRPGIRSALDRVAYAVDGAESSHGEDRGMWGPDPSGPQGPMQVTAAAAADVGGGDRFDTMQNRAIGRAYLALLYWRYKNWPDAIAAYNWGMGNVDAWVKAGRPSDKFLIGVAVYLRRVLRDSGMCDGGVPVRQPREATAEEGGLEGAAFARTVCSELDAWGGSPDGMDRHFLATPDRFHKKLEKAMLLAAQHLPVRQRSTLGNGDRATAVRTSGARRP
jgi:transglycosylase-like protein with SLT domain